MKAGAGVMAGVALAAALVGAGAMWAAQDSRQAADPDRTRIEAVVRDYILANPEIIPQAMQALQAREQGKLVAANRSAFETPYAGGFIGNPKGDVTVVQFFDYACGYCRQSLADVNRLVAQDRNVRVVFRELPILSDESEAAARVSLAAAEQGKFATFHEALYAAGRPSDATIKAASAQAGLDRDRTAATIRTPRVQQEIATNLNLMRSIGATGTPTWIVGDQVLAGAVGYDALVKAVAAARDAR